MSAGVTRRAPGVGRAVILLAACAGAIGCARALAPPGGERDQTAPGVLAVRPEPMATIVPSDEPVVIEFDERISERNVQDAVYVSPATGAVDISKGRRDLEVRIAGGWQPGRVYRVVVRPVLQDLFGNPIRRPLEFAFSTGAAFSDAAIAGVAYERVTGTPVADVRVEARPIDGGAYHLALTDTAGIFRLPLLPPGAYLRRGYADQNRDRRRDAFEPADSMVVELEQTDTLLHALALMRPDSTAANLTRVEVVDSITLRLQLDDYMDVRRPQELAAVRVRTLPDSAILGLAGIHYPHVYEAQRARQDSIAAAREEEADTTVADTAKPAGARAAPRDTVRVGAAARDTIAADTIPPDPLVVRVREAALRPARGAPLPARELIVLLAAPLVPEAEYQVELGGVLNLAGVPGGGGTATFRAPAAPVVPATPAAEEDVVADDEAEEVEEAPPITPSSESP